MNAGSLLTLAALNIVGVIAPGPDIILITRTATRSRRHAAAVTAGIQTGVLMWCTLTVVGAAAFLNAFPQALDYVKIIGGGWLLVMGYRMFVGGVRDRTSPPVDLEDAASRLGTLRQSFWLGLATNLSNPKIVLFLSALIAPLLPPSPSVGLSVLVVLILALSALVIQMSLAMIVSTHTVRRKLLRASPFIDIAAGLFFLVAGATLLIGGVASVVGALG